MKHLSERALVHAEAGFGDEAERKHLESCLHCARRLQSMSRNLSVIARTLGDTAEPQRRPAPFRRWIPLAAAATGMALASLLWIEVAVWRAVTYVPPTMRAEEARAMLGQVSASLFSLGGDPPSAQASPGTVESLSVEDEESERECVGSEWLVGSGCGSPS